MNKVCAIIIAVIFANLTAKGQNLFIIGEKSYPCTNAITLTSNSNDGWDLDVFLAKDGKSGLFAVSRTSFGQEFTGKLIIYLKDGNVLTCANSETSERVDDHTKALYNLTGDQLNKSKASNIHSVKYTLVEFDERNYSASNKGIETSALISEFFKQTEISSDTDIIANIPPAPPVLEEPKEEEPHKINGFISNLSELPMHEVVLDNLA